MKDSPSKKSSFSLFIAVFVLLGGAVALVLWLMGARHSSVASAVQQATQVVNAGPPVQTAIVKKSIADHALSLIGESRPYATTTLYAKVSGYIKEIRVDKGDRVKSNEVLAVIESPETDKNYDGLKSAARIKRDIAKREIELLKKKLVAQQESDQAVSDAEVAEAALATAETMKSYEIVRAPFDGTITARFVDVGALVQNATNSQTSSLPIATVSQINRLRIYIYLDQRDAEFVRVGQAVTITLPENPSFSKKGTVQRITGELDPKTRMLLAEIDVDNAGNEIIAGSYVRVSLTVTAMPLAEVPTAALIFRKDTAYAAVISPANTVQYKKIIIADNDGQHARIVSGVSEGDRVALHLGESVLEGSNVRVVE